MMKKATIIITALCLSTTIMGENKDITIRILATSDVHGCFFPYDFIDRKPTNGSMARVSHYVKEVRKENEGNVVLLDNGDILQGQPTSFYCNYTNPKIPNAAVHAINYMKYDAQTIGNHDIETGHKVYDKWIKEVNCPILGANVVDNNTGKPYLKPYTIVERQGVRIAVLGMLTPAIPNWLKEDLWSGMHFEDMTASTKKWMQYLKETEKPDVIVGLFHSGWNGGISTLHYNEDATEEIAKTVDGFDIIIFGHDHHARNENVINSKGNSVLCLDPGCNATLVADATLRITTTDGKVTGKRVEGKLVKMKGLPLDNDYLDHMKEIEENVTRYVNTKLGTLTETISTSDAFFGSSPFNDLIHEIQLKVTGADISINAPLTFDSKIEKGDILMSDMFKLYKYENNLYMMKMKGYEIRKLLEMSYDQWVNTMTSPDDHIMLLSDNTQYDRQKCGFKNLTFNFDSALGIDYLVDVTKPDGEKVKIQRMSNGEPFVEDKWYRVAMNSYRGNGGGELLTKGAGIPKEELESRILWISEQDQRFYIIDEIMKRGTIEPKAHNNWKFVPEEWTIPAIKRDRKALFEK